MKIEKEELRIMKGPNFWSTDYHKLLILKIRIKQEKEFDLRGLREKLISKLGSIPETHITGQETTEAARLVSAVAMKLLQTAGIETKYSEVTYIPQNDSFNIVFEYQTQESAIFAAETALEIMSKEIAGEKYELEPIFREIKELNEYYSPGPSTSAILDEARKRHIPVTYLNNSLIALGHGKFLKRVAGSMNDNTSIIGVDVAANKDETKQLLKRAFIPVPDGMIIRNPAELPLAVRELGYPLVAKPLNGNHGNGITGNITNERELNEAFSRAQEISKEVIVEKFITGSDFRLLVINYKLVAAAMRTPASVTGNGRSTIQELINEVNSDPRRGEGHGNVMTKITVEDITLDILRSKNMTLKTVLPKGEVLILKDTANMSTGGTSTDITDTVHPDNIRLAERTAETIGLDICGIDVIAPDLTTPITKNGGAILEVNAAPGLRMHLAPLEGPKKNVGQAIINMMFPQGTTGRIPIIAITGTNGKTTTSRLMSHVTKAAGYHVGFTTTDGIYVDGHLIAKGDFTGPKSSEVILTERSVDLAVLECARGGILRSGLAFDSCDIGIVTNVAEDHLGLKDIYTLDDMAKVKSVVAKSVKPEGYAILNAEDDNTYKMANEVRSKVALFSLNPEHPRIVAHTTKGGIAAVLDNDKIVLLDGKNSIIVGLASEAPITLEGKAEFMIANILPVVISAYILGIPTQTINEALKSFHPTKDQTPGRLNIFKFENFEVMVDYAHNAHSLTALAKYLSKVDKHKVGIVTGVGDRRDEDIMNMGVRAAEMYDEIIIRIDSDTRGRTPEEISELVLSGIVSVSKKSAKVIPNETEAVTYAIRHAKPNSLIVISTEKIAKTTEVVQCLQEENLQLSK